jgi:hypothetical protein
MSRLLTHAAPLHSCRYRWLHAPATNNGVLTNHALTNARPRPSAPVGHSPPELDVPRLEEPIAAVPLPGPAIVPIEFNRDDERGVDRRYRTYVSLMP